MGRSNQTESKSTREMTASWRNRLKVGKSVQLLGEIVEGTLEPSQMRMKAIELTLRKSLPDLSATDLTTKGDNISFTMQIGKPKK